jgi:transmembrane sensor
MKKELLLTKYLLQEASLQEAAEAEALLKFNEGDRQLYGQLKSAWDQSWEPIPYERWNEQKAWNNFKEKIAEGRFVKISVPVYRQMQKWWIAASLFLTACCAVWMLLPDKHLLKNIPVAKTQPAHKTIIVNQPAGKDTVISGPGNILLPDGSSVSLKTNSQLSYSIPFNDGLRNVQLKGNAFFQVGHDPAKPFIVTVNNILVKVTGTSFIIWGQKHFTKVEVKTGRVRVVRGKDSIELIRGDKIKVGIDEKGQLHKTKKPLSESERYQQTMVQNILQTLVASGKFSSASEIVSFRLTNTDFFVNGVTFRDELLYHQLKEKYINKPDFGIYYGNEQMKSGGGFHVDRIK